MNDAPAGGPEGSGARVLESRPRRIPQDGSFLSVISGLFLILAVCLSIGRSRFPAYSMPQQKPEPTGKVALTKAPLAMVASENSPARALSDILTGGDDSEYRWTNQHPRVQCWLEDDGPWLLSVDVIVVGDVMKKTGPQTLTFLVNDVVVGTEVLKEPTGYTLEYKVPPAALAAKQPVKAGFDIDKVLVASDGTKLGLLVKSIGFRRSPH
ncbi:MAG: hypothetical protein J0H49_08490 [Acidobacteria bacterium]|nr:hypothetical protein [Acidobacteriota bacterium]